MTVRRSLTKLPCTQSSSSAGSAPGCAAASTTHTHAPFGGFPRRRGCGALSPCHWPTRCSGAAAQPGAPGAAATHVQRTPRLWARAAQAQPRSGAAASCGAAAPSGQYSVSTLRAMRKTPRKPKQDAGAARRSYARSDARLPPGRSLPRRGVSVLPLIDLRPPRLHLRAAPSGVVRTLLVAAPVLLLRARRRRRTACKAACRAGARVAFTASNGRPWPNCRRHHRGGAAAPERQHRRAGPRGQPHRRYGPVGVLGGAGTRAQSPELPVLPLRRACALPQPQRRCRR
jgi:hypothetical protein